MPDIYIFAVFPSDFEIGLSSMNSKHPKKCALSSLLIHPLALTSGQKKSGCTGPNDASEPLTLPLPSTLHC